MKNDMQLLTDAVAFGQGSSMAHSCLLEAMVMTHPNPAALLAAWHRVTAPRVSESLVKSAGRESPVTADADFVERIQAWTEKLKGYQAGA